MLATTKWAWSLGEWARTDSVQVTLAAVPLSLGFVGLGGGGHRAGHLVDLLHGVELRAAFDDEACVLERSLEVASDQARLETASAGRRPCTLKIPPLALV